MTALESAMPHRVVLTTRLSKEECLRRLKAGVGHWMNLFTDKQARGLIFRDRAMLMSSRWFTSHTPVQLRLIDDGSGTRIEGQAGMALASLITMGVLAFLALVGLVSTLAVHAPLYLLAMPLVLIGAIAIALLAIAAMTRRSHAELLAYVRTLLEATDAPAAVVA